jgi:hypothetical protein
MESLIELVAASLARHGIECPDGVSRPAWRQTNSPLQASTKPLPEPTALPEHNYRKILDGDPAP